MNAQFIFVMLIGFAEGIAVGAGFVAFLSVLGIIPRLTQLSKTVHLIRFYEWGIIIGAVVSSWLSLRNPILGLPKVIVIPIGLGSGIFIGMLAAALTEVLNVLPILTKRIGFIDKILILLMAIVLGKVFGSLFHWTIFVDGGTN
ncbi:stage V sporulation protein AB [Pseudalkalibacillus hwajinpoensis]|uniref:Stage V sporulation protein AB n=1 Tax=Guptibacillus hwajinpoensis TaxID=208199 RepID=A0A4U1MHF6_9BACL|nr:stage V sporulation protein AB [Pseudalkalibacillus hwajinpoensis]TKD69915.1 stage V sporulation protein AB [Pseudalkalibacillus hwajinpoensis]